jgi:hypothetical protein
VTGFDLTVLLETYGLPGIVIAWLLYDRAKLTAKVDELNKEVRDTMREIIPLVDDLIGGPK